MNKKAIAETALCRYDKEERCFIVESPLFDGVIGVAETEEEAQQFFINCNVSSPCVQIEYLSCCRMSNLNPLSLTGNRFKAVRHSKKDRGLIPYNRY